MKEPIGKVSASLQLPLEVPVGIETVRFLRRAPNCAFTPDAARASKWSEVIHFQGEPAASSGESGAAYFGR